MLTLNLIGWAFLLAGYLLPQRIYKDPMHEHKRDDLRISLATISFVIFFLGLMNLFS